MNKEMERQKIYEEKENNSRRDNKDKDRKEEEFEEIDDFKPKRRIRQASWFDFKYDRK